MKSLGMVVAAFFLFATTGFAQGGTLSMEPFDVSVKNLSKYLELTSSQAEEVADINDYFMDQQKRSLRSSKDQDKKMHQAVYTNLKLMKGTLTPEQYKKYLVLINLTNSNRLIKNVSE